MLRANPTTSRTPLNVSLPLELLRDKLWGLMSAVSLSAEAGMGPTLSKIAWLSWGLFATRGRLAPINCVFHLERHSVF